MIRLKKCLIRSAKICFLSCWFPSSLPLSLPGPVGPRPIMSVRMGGTGDECTGLADAPYPGSGTKHPCAWAHPFWALDGIGNWKIQGGDTLIISPGSYRLGIDHPGTSAIETPNTGWCDTGWPWGCLLPPSPSGPDPDHPTRDLRHGVGPGLF